MVCLRGNAPTLALGCIAQWLEWLTADQQVPGSNPGVPFVVRCSCASTERAAVASVPFLMLPIMGDQPVSLLATQFDEDYVVEFSEGSVDVELGPLSHSAAGHAVMADFH